MKRQSVRCVYQHFIELSQKRQLHGLIQNNQIQKLPENLEHENRATLYIHWPYCAKMCSYCNFNKYIRDDIDNRRMTDCLVKETETLIKLSGVAEIRSVYFGGGTPSLAESSTVLAILETVRKNVHMETNAEVTLEANPTSTEIDKLREFKDAGVNRLSVGVQSLYNEDLRFLGRQHSKDDALRCISDAKYLFPGNVSVDLIFGRPNQRVEEWKEELKLVLFFCDNHVSLYQLTAERGTPLFKWIQNGSVVQPDDETMADLYETAVETLENRGFVQYEVSNFARNGKIGRHNQAYWEGEQYIGVGPGAHGRFVPQSVGKRQREARVQTLDPNNWMIEVERYGHGTRISRPQSLLEQLEELLVMGLRTKDGITNDTLRRRCTSHTMKDLFYNEHIIEHYIEAELLHIDNSGMRPTKKGLAVLNPIIQDLLNTLNDRWSGG